MKAFTFSNQRMLFLIVCFVFSVGLLVGVVPQAVLAAHSIDYFEGFDDDFIAGRNVPDTVDASLSSPFLTCNERTVPFDSLVIRDREWTQGGVGCGFPPDIYSARLDIGPQGFVTFRFSAVGGFVTAGSYVTFDVVGYGDDAGSLYKYVSSDGVNFTQVGDGSDARITHQFDLAIGGTETYFKLKTGTAADIYEGVHIDNVSVHIISGCPAFPLTAINEDELNSAIACYNDITAPGTYAINLSDDIVLSGPTTPITNATPGVSLQIEGHDYSVDGQDQFRVFYMDTDTDVTFKQIMIQHGYAEDGGGIFNNGGTLTVMDSALLENRVEEGIYFGDGGAIKSTGMLTVKGSTFASNYANGSGGAIHSDGLFDLGGGYFIGNEAVLTGGAIWTTGGEITISNTSFDYNKARDAGGVISNFSAFPMTILNSIFTDNNSLRGAAIYNVSGNLNIVESHFEGGRPVPSVYEGYGGAIWNLYGNIKISRSSFIDNIAQDEGGALANIGVGSHYTIEDSTFKGNSANDGGAIYNTDLGTIEIMNSQFEENVAHEDPGGGGAIHSSGDLSVKESIFRNNHSQTHSGAIRNDGNLELLECEFLGNSADLSAGALWTEGETTIISSRFIENSAGGSGGAIVVYDSTTTTISNSEFTGNTARDGGAIYTVFHNLSIGNTRFEGNHAIGYGGAIASELGTLIVSNSEFLSNEAVSGGGGIYNRSDVLSPDGIDKFGSVTIILSEFSGNTGWPGGAIFNDAGDLTIKNTQFVSNTCSNWCDPGGCENGTSFGGAIYNSANGTTEVANSSFIGNDAAWGGGAIGNSGLLTVGNSQFSGNGGGHSGVRGDEYWVGYQASPGGAISNNGVAHIRNSAFYDQTTYSGGSAISNTGSLQLVNSTLSGNESTGTFCDTYGGQMVCDSAGGGAILNSGSMEIIHSTIVENDTTDGGGGIDNSGDLTIKNTIVANNGPTDCENAGAFSAVGNNLDSDGTCAGFDFSSIDPLLSGLIDEGTTKAHLPLPGSPVIDAVTDCTLVDGTPLNNDQRLFERPGGSACDIGSIEVNSSGSVFCDIADANADLKHDGTYIYTGGQNAQAMNLSSTCAYIVGFASYERVDYVIDHQILYDWNFDIVYPGGTTAFGITLPECAAQVDLFYGNLLESLNGVRYGTRLLDGVLVGGNNFCGFDLSVVKGVNWGQSTPDADANFDICIAGPKYPQGNCKTIGYQGGTLTWEDLWYGEYSVWEQEAGDHWQTSGWGTLPVMLDGVDDPEAGQIGILNTYIPSNDDATTGTDDMNGNGDTGGDDTNTPPDNGNNPPPTCDDPDPGRDLKHTGSHLIEPGYNSGVIENLSNACSYVVGIASYQMVDNTTDNQILFDYTDGVVIGPGETLNLNVSLPACAAQVDLFYGDLIQGFVPGLRYGDRLIDGGYIDWSNWCNAN